MDKHSLKGLKTIEAMGTAPGDWHLTPIKWSRVVMTVPTQVTCPSCRGHGQTNFEEDGSMAVNKIPTDDYHEWREEAYRIRQLRKGKCPTCPPSRKWPGLGTGTVTEYREQEVTLGTPVWAAGTLFDSRFAGQHRDSVRVCELCSKSITGVWSGRVPVQGRGSDGKIHGMWVGEDCARKVLGVEIVLTEEQKQEMKKSVYKRYVIKEGV